MRDYPLPSYAANIWIKGDQIWLGFDGHSVWFPANAKGMELMLATLRERSKSQLCIGQNGQPTQYQVERTLQRDKRWNEMLRIMRSSIEHTEKDRQESIEFLKELGL
jgi:hypothetical protein